LKIHFKEHSFRPILLSWFSLNKRALPWRQSDHWYPVFLSEFLLQQTQVEQALPYYEKFISRFPTVFDLARANQEDVLHEWTGLGYYSRARNMHKTARIISNKYNGIFPVDYQEVIALPGIGPYTAAAILSIAFSKKYAVVDGNVIRVITRLFSIKTDTRLEKTKKMIHSLCQGLIDPEKPGDFNEGLMELGATLCKPKQPLCGLCPVKKFCLSFKNGLQKSIPFKSAPPSKKEITQYVFAVRNNKDILHLKRPDKGLLASMWELPVIDVKNLENDHDCLTESLSKMYGINGRILTVSEKMSHTYSHIKLKYKAVLIEDIQGEIYLEEHTDIRWQKISSENIPSLHKAHQKVLDWIRSLEIKAEGNISG